MKLKLVKISSKSFILVFSIINVIVGLIVGTMVTIMSLLAADEQNPNPVGAWAIIIFPILNGVLSICAGALLTGLFNFFAERFGGLELEFKNEASDIPSQNL